MRCKPITLAIMIRVWCREGMREREVEDNTLHYVEIFWAFLDKLDGQCE